MKVVFSKEEHTTVHIEDLSPHNIIVAKRDYDMVSRIDIRFLSNNSQELYYWKALSAGHSFQTILRPFVDSIKLMAAEGYKIYAFDSYAKFHWFMHNIKGSLTELNV